jgi:hypothetical protein
MTSSLSDGEYSSLAQVVSEETTIDRNVDILSNYNGNGSDQSNNGTSPRTASRNKEIILHLSEHDVLLGRGTGPNECRGNIRFRALVRQALQNADLTILDGKRKAGISKEILDVVKSNNGRFVKIAPHSLQNGVRRTFVAISDDVALDKIRQSFRHQLRVLGDSFRNKNEKDTSPAMVNVCPVSLHSVEGCGSLTRMNEEAVAVLLRAKELSAATVSLQNNVLQHSSQGLVTGGSGLPDFNVLCREAMMREVIPSRFIATGSASTATTVCPTVGATNDSLVSLVNALASLKAETAIRQASVAALHLPSVNPPPLASVVQNATSTTHSQQSQLLAPGLGLLQTRLALTRAFSLSSLIRAQTSPSSARSVLDILLNTGNGAEKNDTKPKNRN